MCPWVLLIFMTKATLTFIFYLGARPLCFKTERACYEKNVRELMPVISAKKSWVSASGGSYLQIVMN
ncbi:hypothetical protein SAMN02745866_04218 [Alteromonadaceae bacterium Bs31]|nr:hypothetical protein SAMN02745866_04218 [Alteromonadaceae bacterium Bs31]